MLNRDELERREMRQYSSLLFLCSPLGVSALHGNTRLRLRFPIELHAVMGYTDTSYKRRQGMQLRECSHVAVTQSGACGAIESGAECDKRA